jgi:DNA-binding transcriptional ArsR family regulator
MPMPLQDIIDLTEPEGSIRISLEEARSVIQSLVLLVKAPNHPGIADWVTATRQAMTRADYKANELVMIGLHYAVVPGESWFSFPAYVDSLAAMDPVALRDKMLAAYESRVMCTNGVMDDESEPRLAGTVDLSLDEALSSVENYLVYLHQRFPPENVDEPLERTAYQLVVNPPQMQRVIVDHLRMMWKKYLAAEWQRVRPVLQQALRALSLVNFKGVSFEEAACLATGQDLNDEKWEATFAQARRLVLVPHPHTGPYTMRILNKDGTLVLFIGARLPTGSTVHAPDLNRAEITVRLEALADDNRLRILRMIAERGEVHSQEIIDELDLSQSAASRQLTQLTAAGFLKERRCDGAKCYALNGERVKDTLTAVANFLMIGERSVM